jgi:hypothetical protein
MYGKITMKLFVKLIYTNTIIIVAKKQSKNTETEEMQLKDLKDYFKNY